MMLCGKFLGNTTQSLYGVALDWKRHCMQCFPNPCKTSPPALTISCLSFGRFYTIYTITAPNAADLHTLECTGFSKAVQKGVL